MARGSALGRRGDALPKKGPGRPAGKPNKLTADLKDMIEGALSDAGGRAYLAQQAQENPAAFMGLVGKLIPKDVNAKLTGDMILKVITGVPDANNDR